MVQLFGVIITVIPYISYMPQILKIIRTRKSEDISITSWIGYVIGATIASIYAILIKNTILILADVSELILCLTTLLLSIIYRHNKVSNSEK